MPTLDAEFRVLLDDLYLEFPGFEIVYKSESMLMKVIDVFLKLITFGQMSRFMTRFITTIGYKVYVNDRWDAMPAVSKLVVLQHERVHMRQREKYGAFLFSFLYLLFPLPTVFAYYRTKFEKEAYEETLRAMKRYHGIGFLRRMTTRTVFVRHFINEEYFWMWPFRDSIERWYDEMVESLEGQE